MRGVQVSLRGIFLRDRLHSPLHATIGTSKLRTFIQARNLGRVYYVYSLYWRGRGDGSLRAQAALSVLDNSAGASRTHQNIVRVDCFDELRRLILRQLLLLLLQVDRTGRLVGVELCLRQILVQSVKALIGAIHHANTVAMVAQSTSCKPLALAHDV